MNKKLKAFTLIELTIALLISSICIGMAFYMLQHFSQLSFTQNKQKQNRFSQQLFIHLLQKDTEECMFMKTAPQEIIFENKKGTIHYELQQNYIVRDQYSIQQDTFFMEVTTLDPEPIQKNLPIPELTDHIKLTVKNENKLYPIVLNNVYAAEQLMKINK